MFQHLFLCRHTGLDFEKALFESLENTYLSDHNRCVCHVDGLCGLGNPGIESHLLSLRITVAKVNDKFLFRRSAPNICNLNDLLTVSISRKVICLNDIIFFIQHRCLMVCCDYVTGLEFGFLSALTGRGTLY